MADKSPKTRKRKQVQSHKNQNPARNTKIIDITIHYNDGTSEAWLKIDNPDDDHRISAIITNRAWGGKVRAKFKDSEDANHDHPIPTTSNPHCPSPETKDSAKAKREPAPPDCCYLVNGSWYCF